MNKIIKKAESATVDDESLVITIQLYFFAGRKDRKKDDNDNAEKVTAIPFTH